MESHYDKLNKKLDRLLERQKKHTMYTTHGQQQRSYPHTINLTNIQFASEEEALLDLGLQYSLQKPSATTWTNLALEMERAIKLLDDKVQSAFRIIAAKKLKQIYNTNHYNTTHKRQLHILKSINRKITNGYAMITRADKGKTTVIIHTHDHANKVHTFLSENNFHAISNDPTNKDHKRIQKALQQCDGVINKQQIKHMTQKNPAPPTLKALLKLHKPNITMRPVVNNRNAPVYKTAKKLNVTLNNHLHLNNQYTAFNSTTLANDLIKLKIDNKHRLLTLDIKDLYINIPIKETIDITRTQLLMNTDRQTTNQIITLQEIILGQNYFSFQGQIYQLVKGVAMGSPISGTMAEIFLKQLEKTHIKQLIDSNNITFYTRYMDDILIVYDSTCTTPKNILQYIDTIHSSIQLKLNQESNDSISFLDLLITRKPAYLEIDIFQKPTAADTTINFLSNHPLEHKLAAY
jgi:hypothetical protein